MAYRVDIDDKAWKTLLKLPQKTQQQIGKKIDLLSLNPRPRGCKKLQENKTLYRIRSGDYRIVYRVDDDRILVLVLHIASRKDIYKILFSE